MKTAAPANTNTNTTTNSKSVTMNRCRGGGGRINSLPQDLIVKIVAQLGATSSKPRDDFKSLITTCKMFNEAFEEKKVTIPVELSRYINWCWSDKQGFFNFIRHLIDCGNLQALYILAMDEIHNGNADSGFIHLRQAMQGGHLTAAYTLALFLFPEPNKRQLSMSLLNLVSSGILFGDHDIVKCTVSGNLHIDRCRNEALQVLQGITMRRRRAEEKRSACGNRQCGIVCEIQWGDPDKPCKKSFCSELCRWTEEYYNFFPEED